MSELRDAKSGAVIRELKGHVHDCTSVAFHPNQRRIASGSRDQTTRIWDPNTGELIVTFDEGSPVFDVVWSPDGRRLASFMGDGTVRIRSAQSFPVSTTRP
ncbi:MAG: hypothetical protein AAF488_15155 [Planctomycetota bacterium]